MFSRIAVSTALLTLVSTNAPGAENVSLQLGARVIQPTPGRSMLEFPPHRWIEQAGRGTTKAALEEIGALELEINGSLTLSSAEFSQFFPAAVREGEVRLNRGFHVRANQTDVTVQGMHYFLGSETSAQRGVIGQQFSLSVPRATATRSIFIFGAIENAIGDQGRQVLYTSNSDNPEGATGRFLEAYLVALEGSASNTSLWTPLQSPDLLRRDRVSELLSQADLPGTIRRAAFVSWDATGPVKLSLRLEQPVFRTQIVENGDRKMTQSTSMSLGSAFNVSLTPKAQAPAPEATTTDSDLATPAPTQVWDYSVVSEDAWTHEQLASGTAIWEGSTELPTGQFVPFLRRPSEIRWDVREGPAPSIGYLLLLRVR